MEFKTYIVEVNGRLEELKNRTSYRGKKKYKKLKSEEFEALRNHLLTNNSKYQELAAQNHSLLVTKDAFSNVFDYNRGSYTTHAKTLEGRIFSNGRLMLEVSDVGVAYTDLHDAFYPKEFKGKIDELGRSIMNVSETGFRFIGSRVPESFLCSILDNGQVHMVIKDWSWEIWGNNYMTDVICDPFKKNEVNRSKFLSNKSELIHMIKDFRNSLLTEE